MLDSETLKFTHGFCIASLAFDCKKVHSRMTLAAKNSVQCQQLSSIHSVDVNLGAFPKSMMELFTKIEV